MKALNQVTKDDVLNFIKAVNDKDADTFDKIAKLSGLSMAKVIDIDKHFMVYVSTFDINIDKYDLSDSCI